MQQKADIEALQKTFTKKIEETMFRLMEKGDEKN